MDSKVEATRMFVPSGHYCSPIVNTTELRESSFQTHVANDQVLGVDIDFDAMEYLFRKLVSQSPILSMPECQMPSQRFHLKNSMYGIGDAIILSHMIHYLAPSRIVEVGSGFSSAVTLDTLDMLGLQTQCTFIEPYPIRLDTLLKDNDRERVRIINRKVQDIEMEVFEELRRDDLLFLDTTHVCKTGSDVNFEIFEILPRLSRGVIVHFHDIFDKFEYPENWIFKDNRSWNEIYLLRAFLMYNKEFEIIYANDAFAINKRDIVENLRPELLRNPGGGLWLRKK